MADVTQGLVPGERLGAANAGSAGSYSRQNRQTFLLRHAKANDIQVLMNRMTLPDLDMMFAFLICKSSSANPHLLMLCKRRLPKSSLIITILNLSHL
ncbi:uncharacterized protein [Scyliorhinus torazame]|uniref:uncharacterized protein isoform X2 n=1 Tax=Scyliorhinus torazame TaxID=75743 RepID=UPI003B5CFD55